jgi:hypothetical protein
MSGHEERRVKARHEVTQYYERRKVVTTRELPRANMTIEGEPSVGRREESSENDDVEDETYVPCPGAHPRGRGNDLANASGSGAARDGEIEEEDDGVEGEVEEEVFDVEEINPRNYVDMGPLMFRVPSNPT